MCASQRCFSTKPDCPDVSQSCGSTRGDRLKRLCLPDEWYHFVTVYVLACHSTIYASTRDAVHPLLAFSSILERQPKSTPRAPNSRARDDGCYLRGGGLNPAGGPPPGGKPWGGGNGGPPGKPPCGGKAVGKAGGAAVWVSFVQDAEQEAKRTPTTTSKARGRWCTGKAGERGRGSATDARSRTLTPSARCHGHPWQRSAYRESNGSGTTAGRTSDPGPGSERARDSASACLAEACAGIGWRGRFYRQRNDMGSPNDGEAQGSFLLLFDRLRRGPGGAGRGLGLALLDPSELLGVGQDEIHAVMRRLAMSWASRAQGAGCAESRPHRLRTACRKRASRFVLASRSIGRSLAVGEAASYLPGHLTSVVESDAHPIIDLGPPGQPVSTPPRF